ncbi:MAG: hypothetical protein IKI03_02185, partial [Clostridia bacterium]|nr:hypothetical protein [Clostridia bacterium]
PRGREGEVSGEGGFELGCSCSPTRNLLPPPSDSFFQRRLFFSREKKSAKQERYDLFTEVVVKFCGSGAAG